MTHSLKDNRFFQALRAESVDRLCAVSTCRKLGAGEYIFREHDRADYICLVVSGSVRLVKEAGLDRSIILATAKAGDYFGEVGMLDRMGRSTAALIETPSEIAFVPAAEVRAVLQEEPGEVVLSLMETIVQYLRETDDRFTNEKVHKEKLHFVGEMASSIIHDFKNPITGIQLAAQLLEIKHVDAETARLCRSIRLQTERMVTMAHELLEFSRGRPELQRQPVPVPDLFSRFELLNHEFIRVSGVELVLGASEGVIQGDPDRLLRVLQNLVGNAVDALAKTPQPRISLSSVAKDSVVTIQVRDNGPGIPVGIRKNFFEPFVTHGKKHGTGLGSAIAKTIVEAHDGTLRFETAAGEGTCFYIELPAAV